MGQTEGTEIDYGPITIKKFAGFFFAFSHYGDKSYGNLLHNLHRIYDHAASIVSRRQNFDICDVLGSRYMKSVVYSSPNHAENLHVIFGL